MKKYSGHDEIILDDFVDFVCTETEDSFLKIVHKHIKDMKNIFADKYIDREEYS